jgi:putative RNA 2'-phosphotransferase
MRPRGEGRDKQISKFLSLVLRHQPEIAALVLDEQGWAPVDAVMASLQRRFGQYTRPELEELVRTSDKQRFAFDESGERIRANQGHSLSVNLGLAPVVPPEVLFHGTNRRVLPAILEEGLIKGNRHHVHLSGDAETAKKVGDRRAGGTIILRVRAGEMAAAGFDFFRSANGVWLTDAVPPAYLDVPAEGGLSIPPR